MFHKNGFDSFSKLQCVPVCMCVFLFEVTYETKCNFLCCLVEIIQFDGQNVYGSQGKNSVKSRNCHTKYFNCNAAQFSKTVHLVGKICSTGSFDTQIPEVRRAWLGMVLCIFCLFFRNLVCPFSRHFVLFQSILCYLNK